MSFNPNLPANNSPIVAAELSNQLNALKALNDGLPLSTPMQDVLAQRTAGNCDGVEPLNMTVGNPPAQARVQAVADKVDEIPGLLQRQ